MALGVGLFSPRAPMAVRVERRLAWRIWYVPTQWPTQIIFENDGAGAKSQAASNNYWVGSSSVMNASAFDDLTFDDVGPFGIGVKAHCSRMQKRSNSESSVPNYWLSVQSDRCSGLIRCMGLLVVMQYRSERSSELIKFIDTRRWIGSIGAWLPQ